MARRFLHLPALFIGALFVFAFPSEAHAGPWTRSLGGYYAKLNVGAYFANGFRDSTGKFQKGVTYSNVSPALYAEAGIWDNLQLMAYVPYLAARNTYDNVPDNVRVSAPERLREGNEYARLSLGDTMVGAQWTSPWLAIPHALRVEAKLPLYDVNGPKGGEQTFFPAPGDGQLDVSVWGSVGKSFDRVPLYTFVELGHMFRTETFLVDEPQVIDPVLGPPKYADSLRWFSQTGLKFLENKYAMLNFAGVWPYKDDPFTKGWVNLGLGLFFPVGSSGLALEANVDQALYVKNSARGTSMGVGVSLSK